MIITEILSNQYQDSINLMLLTQAINALPDVNKSQIMMGSDANKDILNNSGLLTDEAKNATPNDIVIVMDVTHNIKDKVLDVVDEFLMNLSTRNDSVSYSSEVNNLNDAMEKLSNANLALVSIPGEYGATEIEKLLRKGLNVFSFTDNIPIEDESRLKKIAHDEGLLLMGPDCGTGIISGVPLAFANEIKKGNIGIVAASGTGIQEVTTIIDRQGMGVTHAIGTGGHDLLDQVGAITTIDAIAAMDQQDDIDVICVVSKPPSKNVRDKVVELLQSLHKPVVAIFLGEHPETHVGNVYFGETLSETASIAVDLARGNEVKGSYSIPLINKVDNLVGTDKTIIGLYSGGTLASEAAMLICNKLRINDTGKEEGFILKSNVATIIDLGDDIYTKGKPHPMIDPTTRIEKLKEYVCKKNTGVILFDVVLGYGSHEQMATELANPIATLKEEYPNVKFIATVCGTSNDIQGYSKAIKILNDSGIQVEETNENAVKLALAYKGIELDSKEKKWIEYDGTKIPIPNPSKNILNLLNSKPNVINIGVKQFNYSLEKNSVNYIQYNWKPLAGGNKKMISVLNYLEQFKEEIEKDNSEVVNKMKNVQPFLIDVVKAKEVIGVLNDDSHKCLLHAGPPITWNEMTGPMQGSCIGAALFERWAKDENEARNLLANGEVQFIPCHHVKAVGPMGGITSANMPVVVVKNIVDGCVAYCTLNEGIGKVLRFGAYSKEVIDRLDWIRDVLGPTLSEALKLTENGINLNVLIAKSITMGDEFHQRNIAASLNFLKEITPYILKVEVDEKIKCQVIEFLAKTDQFFLNIMMATGKVIVDSSRDKAKGTIVTTMTRNGVDFGIRIAELNDNWYTAPVNTPNGLYFTGFDENDANPDIGDSAITETVGVGAMAMIAAPGVTRFVGAGGLNDAIATSEEMAQICIDRNPNWTIPNWNFEGSVLGIDIRKVVETGITPLINTGIAHKEPGVGQIGAGTVRAPIKCFEEALIAYAISKGMQID